MNRLIFSIICILTLASCTKKEEEVGSLILSVSKTEIFADGTDFVTLTVADQSGKDYTSQAQLYLNDLPFSANILKEKASKKARKRKFKLNDSEVITIIILFHLKGYRCLKHFYTQHVQKHMQKDFPETVSYNRFVELQQKALMPMAVFLQVCCLGKCTGVSFIDSTPIRVCHIKREHQHKTFKGLATKGKCSMGWFIKPKP